MTTPGRIMQLSEVAALNNATGQLTIATPTAAEPGSYALLPAGLNCVGLVVRRRAA